MFDRRNDAADADQHDDALDEIVDDRCHVAAEDHVEGGQDCHCHDAPLVVDVERHAEELGKAGIHRRRIGNEEDEHDCRGDQLEHFAVVALAEVVGHGPGVKVMGHDARAPSHEAPGEQAADDGIADSDPGR